MITRSHSRSMYGSTSRPHETQVVSCIDPGFEKTLYNVSVGLLQLVHTRRAISPSVPSPPPPAEIISSCYVVLRNY